MTKSGENDDDDLSEKTYLIWLLFGFTLMVTLYLILPFPMSMIVTLIVISSLYIITTYHEARNSRVAGIKYWLKSPSIYSSDISKGDNYSLYQYPTFLCMNCGTSHDNIACPKCGSKSVRAASF